MRALTNALAFTADQFNVVRNITTLQLGYLAEDLLSLYWHWRFDEFLYVLREGVRQNWNKTYDRVDAPTVHEWCKAYAAARELQIERDATRAADELKKAELLPHKSDLRQHPTFGRDYEGARAQLLALSDADLAATWRQYGQLTGAENEYIAAVATEVVNERRAAFYAGQITRRLPGHNLPTARELYQRQQQQDQQVELAYRQGNRAAAGLHTSQVPGLYDNLPEHPPFPG